MTTEALKEQNNEERIFIFIAYDNNIPFFSKLFVDHSEMKEFSAKHSSEHKDKIENYSSTYLDLTDKSLIDKTVQMERDKIVGLIYELYNKKYSHITRDYNQTDQFRDEIVNLITNKNNINKDK